ncbi:MAG: hypothetical protein Unbinned1520contig1002_26 [Prokaryotic dsDNA virus sp.]|nr:MAG: hypothetical protein Unbinned1520contig1002_26 [Prokaryotic dsDNA virus sp.]|tara:strand:+ start:3214 stop:3870 length:657 start_codon:yes stop_codon:yes gene_type:complete
MSKERKSFIVHFDSLNVLDDLTNEQAGLLFKAIRSYQLGEELNLDPLTKVAFSPFKNQFSRDAEKYENLCEKNRLIAESRYNTKSTTGRNGKVKTPEATKSTDNDSKSDSDSDSKNSNKEINILCQQIADDWNEVFPGLSQVLKITQKRKSSIIACVKEFKKDFGLDESKNWKGLFEYAEKSDWLMGRTKEGWNMSFDFMINKTKLLKIIEGDYVNAK